VDKTKKYKWQYRNAVPGNFARDSIWRDLECIPCKNNPNRVYRKVYR